MTEDALVELAHNTLAAAMRARRWPYHLQNAEGWQLGEQNNANREEDWEVRLRAAEFVLQRRYSFAPQASGGPNESGGEMKQVVEVCEE